MTLGQKIRLLRRSRGLTQQQIAEELHISQSAVTKWERDLNIPQFHLVVQMCRRFRVTLEEFTKGVEI